MYRVLSRNRFRFLAKRNTQLIPKPTSEELYTASHYSRVFMQDFRAMQNHIAAYFPQHRDILETTIDIFATLQDEIGGNPYTVISSWARHGLGQWDSASPEVKRHIRSVVDRWSSGREVDHEFWGVVFCCWGRNGYAAAEREVLRVRRWAVEWTAMRMLYGIH